MKRLRCKDEIILYKINTLVDDEKILEEKKGLFKKTIETTTVDVKVNITYSLTYRVDEDRFWFNKSVDGEIVDSHHTKNNLTKSLIIIKGIETRLKDLGYNVEEIVDLEKDDNELFMSLKTVSRDIEREKKPAYNNNKEKEKRIEINTILL